MRHTFAKFRAGFPGLNNMGERIQYILLGLFFGLIGAASSLVGLGLIEIGLGEMRGPIPVVSGLMFFFAGAWSFFRGTLGPTGENLPIYPWINYLFVLPILAGFGLLMLLSGLETGETPSRFLGILPMLGALWFGIARFPGRK